MSIPVKNIEKEFLLKMLYDQRLPVILKKNKAEYILFLERQTKKELVFSANKPIDKLIKMEKLNFLFDYHGKIIIFTSALMQINGNMLTFAMPDYLYKDLDRMFPRVEVPAGMKIHFSFPEERLDLPFPRVMEYESGDTEDIFKNIDLKNFSIIVYQMSSLVKRIATAYKLVFFKDTKPSTLEELIVSKTGKAMYLPSVESGLPLEDPFPEKRIITKDIFKTYLESTGVSVSNFDELYLKYINSKADKGILSALWVPIPFQEYIIGYIFIWSSEKGKVPLEPKVIEIIYQYAKLLAQSLKVNDYFKDGKIRSDIFEEKIVDISITGLMFTCPPSDLSSLLLKGSNIIVKMIFEDKTLNVNAKITRRFNDDSLWHIGCRFMDMKKEDYKKLFEYIYNKPFTETDAKNLS